MRIWVVDDEAGILQVIEIFLKRAGHSVACFNSVDQLLRTIAHEGAAVPNLVLMDAMLSGQSGLEVLERLASEWEQLPPMVVMSGDGDVASRVPPTMHWLRKPFSLDELMRLIDRLNSA